MPVVSVVIPTYNRARFIGRAVRSVLDQTFQDFEVIVVDDGSIDDTEGEVTRLRDSRLRFLRHQQNRGAQAARNTGIGAATARYVGFLDSDDTWAPDKLARQLDLFARSPGTVGVVHGRCVVRRDDDTPAEELTVPPLRGNVYPALLHAPGPPFPTILARRECLEAVGRLNEAIVAYQEWDTAIRLAARFQFEWIPLVLATYYRHGGDAISNDWARAAAGYAQIVAAHHAAILRVCGTAGLSRHYRIIATHYTRAHQMPSARVWFRRAIVTDPANLRALASYALSGLGLHAYLRAATLLRRVRAWTGATPTRTDS
jgi:glycosyltransferase involved in cell wall biosynthesis